MNLEHPLVMRIITRLNVGGPARHVLILNEALPGLGFDCVLVTGKEDKGEGTLRPEGLDLVDVPSLSRAIRPVADLKAWRNLRRLICGQAPTIVHTHMAKAGALGRLAAHRAGVPLILHTYHGHVLEGYFSSTLTKALIAVERFLARRSHVLIAVSEQVRDDLLSLGIGREDQWRIVPLGLDLGNLLSMEVIRPVAPERPLRVGIVGRLVEIKDHHFFLKVAEKVAQRFPNAEFVIAGDGEKRSELEEAARHLEGQVRFLGWVEDLPNLYRCLDVVVLTSKNEGTPVALIEACAAGLPVVATDVGGVADVVRPGVNGFLVQHGDLETMAKYVAELLASSEMRVAMGEAGRAWVRDRYDRKRLIDDIVDLYSELLGREGLTSQPRQRP